MRLRHFEEEGVRIEMFPLVDSFFLILVYFIYSFLSMSTHKSIELELPNAQTAARETSDHHGIGIKEDGSLYFNRESVTADSLESSILAVKSDGIPFHIYGDKVAPHGVVVEVLDLLRRNGIVKLHIETAGKEGSDES